MLYTSVLCNVLFATDSTNCERATKNRFSFSLTHAMCAFVCVCVYGFVLGVHVFRVYSTLQQSSNILRVCFRIEFVCSTHSVAFFRSTFHFLSFTLTHPFHHVRVSSFFHLQRKVQFAYAVFFWSLPLVLVVFWFNGIYSVFLVVAIVFFLLLLRSFILPIFDRFTESFAIDMKRTILHIRHHMEIVVFFLKKKWKWKQYMSWVMSWSMIKVNIRCQWYMMNEYNP